MGGISGKGRRVLRSSSLGTDSCRGGPHAHLRRLHTNESSPWDLSMDFTIKLHPDTVGTKALEEYRKVLPRRFKTLKIEGDDLPEFHSGIYVDGEPIGLIKSPVHSPLLGVIALVVLETPYAEDGTKVEVTINGKYVPAEVGPISIFDPEKKKLRG